MSYRDRARNLTPSQPRSTTAWAERPGIVPTAVYTTTEAALLLAFSRRTLDNANRPSYQFNKREVIGLYCEE